MYYFNEDGICCKCNCNNILFYCYTDPIIVGKKCNKKYGIFIGYLKLLSVTICIDKSIEFIFSLKDIS